MKQDALTDVKAIDGVKICWRYTAKCQKDTRVTKIGDPFLEVVVKWGIQCWHLTTYQIAFQSV